ncbi:MAG: glycosyltransferase [Candidatus Eisenbacteria bacterium]|nr:glycosyltransferase [Candidatus Eisenbacteria bacterium]
MMPTGGDIAFVTDARAWGGAEIYLSRIMSALNDSGWRVTLVASDREEVDGWLASVESDGVRVVRAAPHREIDRRAVERFSELLRGFPLVHVNKTAPRNSLPVIPAARRAGARHLVTTEHIVRPPVSHYPLGATVLTGLVRRTNRMVDRIIVVSEDSRRRYLRSYRPPADKVVAIHNGIDLTRFQKVGPRDEVRAELGLDASDLAATVVGRLTPGKGHDTLLDAAPAVLEAVPSLRLLLVGNGPLEEETRARADALGLGERVLFTGFRDDVPDLLAASDLFVLPSHGESFPLTVLEAMAAGLPVIASDVGGICEAVDHGRSGLLVPAAEPEALADALRRLGGDAGLRREMGERGRVRVERDFDERRSIEAVRSLYEDLDDADGGRP